VSVMRRCGSCGGESATPDYCDNCGSALSQPGPAPEGGNSDAKTAAVPAIPGAEGESGEEEVCPGCGTRRPPGARYCEIDGFDFELKRPAMPPGGPRPVDPGRLVDPLRPVDPPPTPGATGSWAAFVAADRAFFESNLPEEGSTVVFPEGLAPRKVALCGDMVVIGRRRSANDNLPGIDLSGPTGDPGVSRRHAVLALQSDGYWAVQDTRSMNGTWVNGRPSRLKPDELIVLGDGDRIHVGAFTVITLRRVAGTPS